MKNLMIGVLGFMITSGAVAGTCELQITRVACPGKEAEAFKPYKGEKSTKESKTVADAAACKGKAEQAAKIVRKGTLSEKSVVATFDGAPVAGTFKAESPCS